MFRYYVSFLFLSLLIVTGANVLIGMPFWHSVFCVFGGAIFIFVVDAIIAWILHAMPEKWFDDNKRIFKVFRKERKFYEKIGIKNWKDKVPETGQVCNFKKNKIASFNSNYIKKFLIETCYAEVIHIAMLLIGLTVFFVIPFSESLNYSLWLFLINAILNIPPVLIQRYNRPKLQLVLLRSQRQSKHKEIGETEEIIVEQNEEALTII